MHFLLSLSNPHVEAGKQLGVPNEEQGKSKTGSITSETKLISYGTCDLYWALALLH